MIYLNLLMISLVLVFIIDISGVVDHIKRLVWRWVYKGKHEYRDFEAKPFDCSLCATWWCGLIYLCFTHLSFVNVAYVALLAYATPIFKDLLTLVKDFAIKLIDTIYMWYDL